MQTIFISCLHSACWELAKCCNTRAIALFGTHWSSMVWVCPCLGSGWCGSKFKAIGTRLSEEMPSVFGSMDWARPAGWMQLGETASGSALDTAICCCTGDSRWSPENDLFWAVGELKVRILYNSCTTEIKEYACTYITPFSPTPILFSQLQLIIAYLCMYTLQPLSSLSVLLLSLCQSVHEYGHCIHVWLCQSDIVSDRTVHVMCTSKKTMDTWRICLLLYLRTLCTQLA